MQKPLISILIPFKNTELYLGDCIDSIVKQSYSNWELKWELWNSSRK